MQSSFQKRPSKPETASPGWNAPTLPRRTRKHPPHLPSHGPGDSLWGIDSTWRSSGLRRPRPAWLCQPRSDLTNHEFRDKVQSYFQKKVDLIISDASINKIGNKFSDNIKQINLCYSILDIAKIHLKHKGVLVLKTFQGSDFNKLVTKIKKEFRILKALKPRSSKKKSNEIYLIGLQKR